MADVFVWFSDLVDAAHGPVLGQFITQEDHQYLEHVCEHATNRLAGQRIGTFYHLLVAGLARTHETWNVTCY